MDRIINGWNQLSWGQHFRRFAFYLVLLAALLFAPITAVSVAFGVLLAAGVMLHSIGMCETIDD